MNRYYRTSLEVSSSPFFREGPHIERLLAQVSSHAFMMRFVVTRRRSLSKKEDKKISLDFFFKRNVTLNIKIDKKTLNSLMRSKKEEEDHQKEESKVKKSALFVVFCVVLDSFIHFFVCFLFLGGRRVSFFKDRIVMITIKIKGTVKKRKEGHLKYMYNVKKEKTVKYNYTKTEL